MSTQYLMPMARNTVTHQVVKRLDLGSRIGLQQRSQAELLATKLALDMTNRTGQQWVSLVKPYTV
jgi:hypothetical protein